MPAYIDFGKQPLHIRVGQIEIEFDKAHLNFLNSFSIVFD